MQSLWLKVQQTRDIQHTYEKIPQSKSYSLKCTGVPKSDINKCIIKMKHNDKQQNSKSIIKYEAQWRAKRKFQNS